MAPHAPPCSLDEILWGGVCYPSPDMQIVPSAQGFDVIFDHVAPEILPLISDLSGDGSRMIVEKNGAKLGVTVSSIGREDATSFLGHFRPNDPDATLPE